MPGLMVEGAMILRSEVWAFGRLWEYEIAEGLDFCSLFVGRVVTGCFGRKGIFGRWSMFMFDNDTIAPKLLKTIYWTIGGAKVLSA